MNGSGADETMTLQKKLALPEGVGVIGQFKTGCERVLTREAMDFVARLHRAFLGRIAGGFGGGQLRIAGACQLVGLHQVFGAGDGRQQGKG